MYRKLIGIALPILLAVGGGAAIGSNYLTHRAPAALTAVQKTLINDVLTNDDAANLCAESTLAVYGPNCDIALSAWPPTIPSRIAQLPVVVRWLDALQQVVRDNVSGQPNAIVDYENVYLPAKDALTNAAK